MSIFHNVHVHQLMCFPNVVLIYLLYDLFILMIYFNDLFTL